MAFDWPDIDAEYRYEGVKEQIESCKAAGYAVTGDMVCTIFETAWQLRGLETFLIDMYEEEEMVDAICRNLCKLRINQARKLAELGVDIIRLGDDVATQNGPLMSREHYGRFFKTYMKQIIDAAIYEKYGDRLAFWGGIGTQSTMPFGTPKEVAAAVEEVQNLPGKRRAPVIAPSHILEPEVLWENVISFIETSKKSFYK